MPFFNLVAWRDALPFEKAASHGHSRQTKTWAPCVRRAALLLALTASGGVIAMHALAAGAGPITFYGDIEGLGQEPFPSDPSTFLVRPSQILLTEDGSADLEDLQWSGWGTSVARATGVRSASDGIPDMATGKRTKSPIRLTLSNPGVVLGHLVYRCFRIDPPDPGLELLDQGCLHRDGTSYSY